MKKHTVHIIIFLMLLYSCAQITPLTGGEKDITPPQPIKIIPGNYQTNLNPDKILIEFDEYIQLKNINKQFLSSPTLNHPPKFKLKGKSLIITISDTLKENTTYTFSFGNSIVDITENNALPNFKYVFSTGTVLDSLQVSGNIIDAYKLTPSENLFVMLYENQTDTFFKTRPTYVSISDKSGNFMISNIKKGNYRILALKDINNNYLYDLPNEDVGFLPNEITLDSNISNLTIKTYNSEDCLPKIKKNSILKNGSFLVLMNNYFPDDVSQTVINMDSADYLFTTFGDSLVWWFNTNVDSAQIVLKYNNNTDTLLYRKPNKIDQSVVFNILPKGVLKPNQLIRISAKQPISINKDMVFLYEDSVVSTFSIYQLNNFDYQIKADYVSEKKYRLTILPKAITNHYKKFNTDTITQLFKVNTTAAYGNLTLKLSPTFNDNYIIKLTDKSMRTIYKAERNAKNTLFFDNISPGKYYLYCIVDKNNNHKWDCGDIVLQHLPETVIAYKNNPVMIMQNWEQEIEWELSVSDN